MAGAPEFLPAHKDAGYKGAMLARSSVLSDRLHDALMVFVIGRMLAP